MSTFVNNRYRYNKSIIKVSRRQKTNNKLIYLVTYYTKLCPEPWYTGTDQAVQIKHLFWSAKHTTDVPRFFLQNCNVKRDSTQYTPPPLTASNTLTVTAVTKLDAMGSS